MEAIDEHFVINEGVGVELHPYDVNDFCLRELKDSGVTKISIGIQSFQEKYQSILGRNRVDPKTIQGELAKVSFETVSMDFIFALLEQTVEDLKTDIDEAFNIGANHVAIYPFIGDGVEKMHDFFEET